MRQLRAGVWQGYRRWPMCGQGAAALFALVLDGAVYAGEKNIRVVGADLYDLDPGRATGYACAS